MKIRNGFVSNSSSSSFIIYGEYIDINNISFDDIKKNEIYAIGRNASEGFDVFKVKNVEEFIFLKVYQKLYHNSDNNFDFIISHKNDISSLDKLKRISVKKNYNSSNDINDIEKRYDVNGDVSKEIVKFLRKEKINKIQEK